jgi:choline dehydrogenase-like flavoprotein
MPNDFHAIVIGTGFGANVVASNLAARFPNTTGKPKVLMLERGVWWFSPERPFPPPFATNYDAKYPPGDRAQNPYTKHPVQYWPRPDHRRGVLDLLNATWGNIIGGDRRDFSDAPQPLMRYNMFDELDVLTASGVGGGSLVYSNVSIRPYFDGGKAEVMENWPLQLTETDYDSAENFMATYRGKPSQVVTKFPIKFASGDFAISSSDDETFSYLGRSRYLKEASAALKADATFSGKYNTVKDWGPLNLAIIEYPDPQPTLDKKAYCERQGRCFLGCLPGARQTLNKSIINHLLYTGGNPPVELRSLAEVTGFDKIAGGWKVKYEDLRFGDGDAGRHKEVTTDVLILSAGCLFSTELMLRAANHGLTFSRMLGEQFSTNGDYAGFIDHPRDLIDRTKFNPRPYGIFATKGPINTSHVMFKNGKIQVNFEDAAIPSMVAPYVRAVIDVVEQAANDRQALFNTLSAMWKLTFEDLDEAPDARIPQNYMTEAEQLEHTFFFNLMGRNQKFGTFSLNGNNKLQLNFQGGLHNDPVYQAMEEVCQAMAQAMNGKYIRFPFWGKGQLLDNNFDTARKFITVHPLGGCVMGTDSSNGVVNTNGQVYNTVAGANTVHDGLYIADASVIPGPLAVNPTLSIVAMAQKIAAAIP